MLDFKTIYARHADAYQRLVSHEDYEGNLFPAIMRICPPEGLNVVEFGAGTGRLTTFLAPFARRVIACDQASHMLSVALERLLDDDWENWLLAVAENARVPVRSGWADLAIEGWSFGHLTGWYPDSWQTEVECVLAEMIRLLRPGGTALVIETLGTGAETPEPPTDNLAAFYELLEGRYGFQREWVRTDYRFESPRQAAEVTRFFFGDELAEWLIASGRTTLPECTGLWWRRVG